MERCVIVSGGDIGNYGRIREYLRDDDYLVFCDCGLRHAQPLGVSPSLAVGDFDSFEKWDFSAETVTLPCEKDDTDTLYAVKEALRRGFSDFLLVGALGGRFDHALGNLSILLMLDSLGKKAKIVDDLSETEVVPREGFVTVEPSYSYFSLISLSERTEGVTVKNAKYPLTDGVIGFEYQYGISNETLPGKSAEVSVKKGRLLLIKVF